MNDKANMFKYDLSEDTTTVTMKEERAHAAFFINRDVEEEDDPHVIIDEPPMYRLIKTDGGASSHWRLSDLRKHVAICEEAIAQVDYCKTAYEERRYQAYCDALDAEEAARLEGR